VDPKDEELREVVGMVTELLERGAMVTELLERGADVYVNVNNHYEGSAPLTIDRISRLL